MSTLYKLVNGFDSFSGAAFGGGGGGGRGDQSRRAEAVRSANAARAKAAAATAAANQRQKEQNEVNRQNEMQATIRAAEKKEATRQASIAAANQRAQEDAQEQTKLQATRPQSASAYSGDGAIDVILYGHDQASLNNASSSYMDSYNGCMVAPRVTLAKDIISFINVTDGKASGAVSTISLGIALYDYSASSLNCVSRSAP
jgi:hypothetical protein